jgi:glycosyltransferase involved in cell wall biosynthesis
VRTLVVIPAYNEAESIVRIVESVIQAGYDYVVINDGSTDDTLAICRSHGINVINLEENLGIGGAVQTGHRYAREHDYDVDIQFDGDGQHDTASIPVLLAHIEKGVNLVVGSRFIEKTDGFRSSLMRRIGIKWLSFLIKLITGQKIYDVTSGFRVCDRKTIELYCHNYPVDYPEPESIVMAIKQGLTVVEAPAIMHERQGGKSSIRIFSSVYYMVKVTLAILITGVLTRGKREAHV